MAGNFQPISNIFAIVDQDGTPTDYFIRWAQDRQIDIGEAITEEQAQQFIADWAAARQIIAGIALDGGGYLSGDVTIDHSESLVVPGTYGDSTHVPQIVIDQEGHIQGVALVAIAGGGAVVWGDITGLLSDQTDLQTALDAKADLDVFTSVDDGLTPASGGGAVKFLRADGSWAVPPGTGGGSLPDGDYGDIVVSGGGTVMDIDAGVVGPTELANTTVAPGLYTNVDITVDAQGRITAAANGSGSSGGVLPIVDGSIPAVFLQNPDGSLIYGPI